MRPYQLFVAFILSTLHVDLLLAEVDRPTFAEDVAAIIHEKCSTCHRPNSSGPFSLLTYEDVRQRASTIEAVLEANYMPPWKPIDHGLEFTNDRSLSEAQLRTLRQWIAEGCREGERSKTPEPPQFHQGWSLGEPDWVVEMNGSFEVPADGPDIYRSFVFPLDLPEDKWVKAVELRPRATSSVHHALFFVDATGNARTLDGADGQAGLAGMGFLSDFGGAGANGQSQQRPSLLGRLGGSRLGRGNRQGQTGTEEVRQSLARGLGGYVPGSTPNLLPGDLARPLPKGSDIVMQTHFHPSGKSETEDATLALYFADQAPSRELMSIMMPPMFGFGAGIKVPAGESDFRIHDTFTLPVETMAVGVSGHAHYICRSMKMTATLPDGQVITLLEIDDWDLDWQDQYQFERPVRLPADTRLDCELVYDNSSDNPENPHYPPREIRWGRGSTDEMGSMTLNAVTSFERDQVRLQAAVLQHSIESLINRDGEAMVQMLMQLDDDHDGKLQPTEAPRRFTSQVFRFIDSNRDGAIDSSELSIVIQRQGGRGRN